MQKQFASDFATQKELVAPGRPKKVLTDEDRSDRVVAALLANDERATKEDLRRTSDLSAAWARKSQELAPQGTTVLMPEGEVSRAVAAPGLRAVFIAPNEMPAAATTSADRNANVRTAALGYGKSEMASFAAMREVVADAEVVFITSAHYHNASGLAYALRDDRKPIIAVLTNSSTHGDKLPEIIKVIEPKIDDRQLVVANNSEELVSKVIEAVRARREAQKKAKQETPAKTGGRAVGLD
jgi:hypothetical protein